jgi:hypothetical protein
VVTAGLQAVVVIDTQPTVAAPVLAGVVTRPTSLGYPTGLPGSAKELVLTEDKVTWFPGFSFDAARIARYALSYLQQAPDGFPLFGEIDWQGGIGLSCSIHGPTSRYFAPYLAPHVFDTAVYSEGRLLFDGAEYVTRGGAISQSGWLVIGAALRRDDEGKLILRVVHGETSSLDAYLENYDAPFSLPAGNVCPHAVIDYEIDEATYTATDTFWLVATFDASKIGAPFHFDITGMRAVRMVVRWAYGGADPTRRIERIVDDTLQVTDMPNEAVRLVATYGGGLLGYAYTNTVDDEIVAIDYVGDTEVYLKFRSTNVITGDGAPGATLDDRPDNQTTFSVSFEDGPQMPIFYTHFRSSFSENFYFTTIDIRHRVAAQLRRANQGIAVSGAAVTALQKPNVIVLQSIIWTPARDAQAELALDEMNVPALFSQPSEPTFAATGLTRGNAMPAPLSVDYYCSVPIVAQFANAYDSTAGRDSATLFFDPTKPLFAGKVKTHISRPVVGQSAGVGNIRVVSQLGFAETYHSWVSGQQVRKATGFEGPTALYPMTVLPSYNPLT